MTKSARHGGSSISDCADAHKLSCAPAVSRALTEHRVIPEIKRPQAIHQVLNRKER